MDFELAITIDRAPAEVFAFLRDKDRHTQEADSPVLLLEKTTPGPAGAGTRYREVVQMLPFFRGEILSEITRFEPDGVLEEDFAGAGMEGHLAYRFLPADGGTQLIQRETLHLTGPLRLLAPLVERMLARRLLQRLEAIKQLLESDWPVNQPADRNPPSGA
jgi:hypothetical protein